MQDGEQNGNFVVSWLLKRFCWLRRSGDDGTLTLWLESPRKDELVKNVQSYVSKNVAHAFDGSAWSGLSVSADCYKY